MTLLRTEDLTKKYSIREGWFQQIKDYDVAVDNVTLSLKEGEVLGLVGESGSGKSTLAELLLKLETPDSGQIFLRGNRIDQLSQRAFRPHRTEVQIIFQDPGESFDPRYSVRQSVAEGLINLTDLTRQERLGRIKSLLGRVNLGLEVLEKFPHQLSGGQRQRVGIARALAVNPDVLVLDEPTSALDVSIQARILNLLLELKKEFGLTYLFISHDLNLIRYISDRITVMKGGQIVEEGDPRAIYESPDTDYTRQLLTAARKHRPNPTETPQQFTS